MKQDSPNVLICPNKEYLRQSNDVAYVTNILRDLKNNMRRKVKKGKNKSSKSMKKRKGRKSMKKSKYKVKKSMKKRKGEKNMKKRKYLKRNRKQKQSKGRNGRKKNKRQ